MIYNPVSVFYSKQKAFTMVSHFGIGGGGLGEGKRARALCPLPQTVAQPQWPLGPGQQGPGLPPSQGHSRGRLCHIIKTYYISVDYQIFGGMRSLWEPPRRAISWVWRPLMRSISRAE